MNTKPNPSLPKLQVQVIQLADQYFSSSAEAREAIRRAIDEIPDDHLLQMRGIQVLLMG